MAFLQLTACGSFSHEACHLLVPFRPDCAQCLTGNSPQAVLALSSHGQARQVCETWWLVAQLPPYSQDGAYKLSLSCFCFFFFFSLQPQD